MPLRLAILSSHPIQYQVPLFRALASKPGVDLTVLFCDDHGVRPSFDRGFGKTIQFDVPLLEGYEHRFLRNLAPRPGVTPTGLVNPDVVSILRSGELDAMVVHGYGTVTSATALLVPNRRTRVLLRGDSNLLQPRKAAKRLAKQLALRALFRRVDHFLAIGTLNREYYEAYGVGADRITIAPFSVDNAYFGERSRDARRDPAAVRRAYGLRESGPLFTCAAKLVAVKRPFDVLRAFHRAGIADRASLAYVGDGELRPALEAEIEVLGLRHAVRVLGFANQSELPAIYGASDAVVLASEADAWGLVVNEAMACGAAAFVSDRVGAAPDLVADPDAIFAVGDVQRLAAQLRRAVDEPGWLTALRSNAHLRIARWGVEETAAGVIEGAQRALADEARRGSSRRR